MKVKKFKVSRNRLNTEIVLLLENQRDVDKIKRFKNSSLFRPEFYNLNTLFNLGKNSMTISIHANPR